MNSIIYVTTGNADVPAQFVNQAFFVCYRPRGGRRKLLVYPAQLGYPIDGGVMVTMFVNLTDEDRLLLALLGIKLRESNDEYLSENIKKEILKCYPVPLEFELECKQGVRYHPTDWLEADHD